jgi:methyl-accepting chemotaxis protein
VSTWSTRRAPLNEIVESIKKVAGIVSDIATASAEQASGIEQVNKALTQMDEVTQQNSALVEENAATAKTLEQQAMAMNDEVSVFRVDAAADAPAAPQKRSAPAAARPAEIRASSAKPAASPRSAGNGAGHGPASGRGGPVGRMQAALATAVNTDPEWKEF